MINTNLLKAALLLAPMSVFAANNAGNAPVVGEMTARGGMKVLSLDFDSAGDANAVSILVELPAGSKKINTGNCVKELPQGIAGVCTSEENRVAVTFYATNGGALPKGVVRIGTVQYGSGNAKAMPVVSKVDISSVKGEELVSGKATVEKLD